MLGHPGNRYVFSIRYMDGSSKSVPVCDWNLGGAWATLCRDLNKSDHGDTNKVESICLVAVLEVEETK